MSVTYQPIIREFKHIYEYNNLNLQERGLLHHLYLMANPKTGIYMTHARRLAEETCTHVETVRATQKRLKKCGLIIYKHTQTARLRPYYISGFILYKTSAKDMYITRTCSEILSAGVKMKIFSKKTTEKNVVEFLDMIGDTWPQKFFPLFSKRVHSDMSVLDSIPNMAIPFGPEIEDLPAGDNTALPGGNGDTIENQKIAAAYLKQMAQSVGYRGVPQ
jgi:hypothetical protein